MIKRVFDNGVYRDATPEEAAEIERMAAEIPKPEPTPEERIRDLEEKLKAAEILLGLEV